MSRFCLRPGQGPQPSLQSQVKLDLLNGRRLRISCQIEAFVIAWHQPYPLWSRPRLDDYKAPSQDGAVEDFPRQGGDWEASLEE